MNSVLRSLLLVFCLLPSLRAAELAQPGEAIDTVAGLVQWGPLLLKLANQGAVYSTFSEERWFPIRKKPTVLEGELRFSQELGLSLRYLKPEEKMMILDDKGLLLRDAKGRQKASSQDTAGSELGRSLMSIFAFDPEQLRERFFVCGNRDGEDWRIDLQPRDPKQAALLGTVTVFGRGEEIRRLMIKKSGNQRVEITIRATRQVSGFTQDERRRYFR